MKFPKSESRAQVLALCVPKRSAPLSNSNRWVALGQLLSNKETTTVLGEPLTKCDCFIKALLLDPSNVRAWRHLHSMNDPGVWSKLKESLTSNDQTRRRNAYRQRTSVLDFCIDSMTSSPSCPSSWWMILGELLSPRKRVTVMGECITKYDCYLKAVTLDSRQSIAWCKLGCSLGDAASTIDEASGMSCSWGKKSERTESCRCRN